MALLTSELWRIRYELGYPTLTIGALPYVDLVSIFEQVIAPYTEAGAITTSATVVAAPTAPTLTSVVLASATGFSAGDRVWLDVDAAQESATVRSMSGSTIVVSLSNAHGATGGYPVTVDGGEAIIRELLGKIAAVSQSQGDATSDAGVKKVDEIEFFPSKQTGGSTVFGDLNTQREYWRRELADTLGVVYLRRYRRGNGSGVAEVY